MKISIIVPVYNVEKYIDKCISSVINQTYNNFELILINDGTTDSSLEKCLVWAETDNRIILVSKSNAGLGPTRNLGMNIASGEYVTFLDSDDWWHQDYLLEMVAGTENGKNDIVVCDLNYVDVLDNGELRNNVSSLRLPSGAVNKSEWDCFIRSRTFMWGKLYRKKLFVDNAIVQPAHTYEDVATTPFLLVKAEGLYHVNKPLYFYLRNRIGSIVSDFRFIYDMEKSLVEIKQRFSDAGIFEQYQVELALLFWGQMRFVLRKIQNYTDAAIEEKEKVCTDITELVLTSFPKLKNIYGKKFYVQNKEILIAIKNLAVYEDLVCTNNVSLIDNCDYIVGYNDEIFDDIKLSMDKLITVPKSVTVGEIDPWDLADDIFKAIYNR